MVPTYGRYGIPGDIGSETECLSQTLKVQRQTRNLESGDLALLVLAERPYWTPYAIRHTQYGRPTAVHQKTVEYLEIEMSHSQISLLSV